MAFALGVSVLSFVFCVVSFNLINHLDKDFYGAGISNKFIWVISTTIAVGVFLIAVS